MTEEIQIEVSDTGLPTPLAAPEIYTFHPGISGGIPQGCFYAGRRCAPLLWLSGLSARHHGCIAERNFTWNRQAI